MQRGCLHDFGGQTAAQQLFVHGFEIFQTAGFHGTFAFIMNQKGTLLGLLQSVVANFNKCLNYVIKGVDIIIPQNELIHIVFFFK